MMHGTTNIKKKTSFRVATRNLRDLCSFHFSPQRKIVPLPVVPMLEIQFLQIRRSLEDKVSH